MSAVDDDDDTSVVRASEQRNDASLDPRTAPGVVDSPMSGISVPEPLEHSVLDVDLDGKPMEGISVPEPLEHSVLGVPLDGRPMSGISVPEPLEHLVLDVDLDGRPMEGISVPEPLEHSGLDVALEGKYMEGISAREHSVLEVMPGRRPKQGISVMEPLEHSVPDFAPVWGASSFSRMAVSNPLQHSGLHETDDVGPGLLTLEPLEHSVLVFLREESDVAVTDVTDVTVLDPVEYSGVEMRVETMSAYLLRVFSDHQGEDVSLLNVRPEAERDQPEAGESIVVGAVGSAAPCFLTGWANDIEIDSMIDTGCQVTILATTVFEQMCAADPMVRSKLRPCRRRLVSADSSPLTVKGELELNVVFPGLRCPAVMPTTSAGSSNGTVVGGRPINIEIAPAKIDPRSGRILDDFGGVATGQ